MKPPPEIQDLCRAFLDGLKAVLGEKLCGVYLYGALAFPEGGSTGDIDFHVILNGPLSDTEKSQLHDLHRALARDLPPLEGAYLFNLPLDFESDLPEGEPGDRLRQQFEDHRIYLSASGSMVTQVREGRWQIDDLPAHRSYVLLQEGEAISIYGDALDGYYILLQDARQRSPPQHQLLPGVSDDSWALHRQHMRAGRCIVLHGPHPRQVYPPATWPEIASALQGELDYVEKHLDEYPQYCVLNLCRLMYSYATRDVVVSKRMSAAWACDAFPQWSDLIEAARKAYDRRATTQDKELLQSGVTIFFDFACQRIQESLGATGAASSPPV
jgi:hypothetical protein